MRKKPVKSSKLVDIIIAGIQEKKGKDIISLNFKNLENAVCNYFVICTGDSNIHVDAIANSIEEVIKKQTGTNAWHKEGFENSQWILLDYFDVVVHIFQPETRDFYNLEGLWADAEVKKIVSE